MTDTLAAVAKAVAAFITAAVGAAGEAITLSLVHGDAAKWVTIGIGAATAVGAYLAVFLAPKNAGPPAETLTPIQPPVVPPVPPPMPAAPDPGVAPHTPP